MVNSMITINIDLLLFSIHIQIYSDICLKKQQNMPIHQPWHFFGAIKLSDKKIECL